MRLPIPSLLFLLAALPVAAQPAPPPPAADPPAPPRPSAVPGTSAWPASAQPARPAPNPPAPARPVAAPPPAARPAPGSPAADAPNAAAARWDDGALRLGGDALVLEPVLRLDAHAGAFSGQDRPGGFRSGVNLRRGRLGVQGTLWQDIAFNFTWDFGGSDPRDYGEPYEAQISYSGLGWGTLRIGGFRLLHLPEYAASSFDGLFLERAAITNLVASLGSGSARTALGLEAHGERWVASAYASAGELGTRNDDGQRALVGRAAALLPALGPVQLQLGLDALVQFRPGGGPGYGTVGFADYPELRVDSRRFLDTPDIPARHAWALGPEAAGRIGPVYAEALYQRIGVATAGGGERQFGGWYAQLAVPLLGPPRERDAESGTWGRPKPREAFDPAAGHWGALELAGRFSTADLRDGPVRGARQSIWTAGLNWYPSQRLRLGVQYENGTLAREDGDRDFQAVGLRAAFSL